MVDACGRKTNSRYQLKNKTNTELSKQNKQTNTQTKTSNQKSKISILKFTTTVAIIIYTSLHSVAHTFYRGDTLFILLSMWASYSPRESPGMLAEQAFTMAPKTKHSPTKRHRTNNAAYSECQWNRRWRSDEETKPSERVSVVIICDSYASTWVGKHSSAWVSRKI